MPRHDKEKALPETHRKQVFLALVKAQDRELSVSQSRQAVAQQFGLTDEQVRTIEEEGLDNEWPPL